MTDEYKPKWKVGGLAITRDVNGFSAKWNVPRAAVDDSKTNCFTGIYCRWMLHFANPKAKPLDSGERGFTDESMSSLDWPYTRWKGNYKPYKGEETDRKAFYPCTSRKVSKATISVFGIHRDGNKVRHDGGKSTASYVFKPPLASTVEWTYDQQSAEATVKVKAGSQRDLVTGKKTDVNEHYDTQITVTLTKVDGKTVNLLSSTTPYKEWSHTFDVSSYISGLSEGKGVKVTCTATPRGMAGDGKKTEESLTVGMPMKPSIKSIAYEPAKADVAETGRVIVTIDTGKKKDLGKYKGAVVSADEVKLRRKHGEDGTPEDVAGAVDDSGATKLYDSIGAIWPSGVVVDDKIYYQVVSTDSGYSVYSDWAYAEALYVKDPVECHAAVEGGLTVSPNRKEAGTAIVKMRWLDSTVNDGVELSWANTNDAWKSGSGPSTETFAAGTRNGSETTKFYIPDESKPTYFRFRRYRDVGGKRYFSDYWPTLRKDPVKYLEAEAEAVLCAIMSATASDDGTSVRLEVGWRNGDDAESTEVSWSTSEAAWTSDNTEVSTATYSDPGTASGGPNWPMRATLTVNGSFAPGTVYYFRARRAYRDEFGPYSNVAKVKCASAAGDECKVESVTSDVSGTRAEVVVLVDEDNENTGTEIAWSTDEDAFRSSEQPSVMEATWPCEATGDQDWPKRQVSFIKGLEPGALYHVWARRYLGDGDSRDHGEWSEYATVTMADPSAVTASDDSCEIVDLEVDASGRGARLVVGWTEDNPNDGTEISWSSDDGAWQSNQGPSTMQATWQDKESQDEDFMATQTVFLRGLELGTHYFVKARRYLSADSSFSEYGETWNLTTPDEAGDPTVVCAIIGELTEPVDGDTVRVVVGWEGDRTGCEVSWSTDPDAWESSEQPQTFEFGWSDDESQSQEWHSTGTVYVSGLEDGVPCYFRARSYYETEGNRVYSERSEAVLATPYSAPDSVTLSAPEAVARGEAIEAYWSISGELEQTEWHIHEAGSPNSSPISGEGSLMHASIPADRYSGDTFSFYVEVGCGGGLTESNTVEVAIADVPSCECACAGTLESQPATFEAYTDDPRATVLATCRSTGATFQMPDGDSDQLAGDTVWTEAVPVTWEAATWADTLMRTRLADAIAEAQDDLDAAQDALDHIHEGEEGYEEALAARDNAATALADAQAALAAHPADGEVYMAEVEMPPDAYLVDGGTYTVDVQTEEPVAGLRSETAQCAFTVAWAHQAPTPDSVTVAVDVSSRSATLTFGQSTGWAAGDAYDLYRSNDTGFELCLADIAAGSTVTDMFAPFGEREYRVACRTADGDVAFDDFAYSLPVKAMRFDWPGGSVELPYNVELSDSYEKSFEARDHVDGTVNGYYDRAVHRTGSYQASVVKADSGTISSLRALGEHPRASFCRTASGSAFQCNADLGGIDLSYASMAAGVSIPITEMRLTSEFMAEVV